MKAKRGFSGLELFPLSFSSRKSDLLSVAGSDAKMREIGELLDSGAEAEARDLLRKALYEVTHNLDSILAEAKDSPPPPVLLGTLLLNE